MPYHLDIILIWVKEKDQEENVQKDLAKLSEGGLRVRERIWTNVLEKKKKKRKIVL